MPTGMLWLQVKLKENTQKKKKKNIKKKKKKNVGKKKKKNRKKKIIKKVLKQNKELSEIARKIRDPEEKKCYNCGCMTISKNKSLN